MGKYFLLRERSNLIIRIVEILGKVQNSSNLFHSIVNFTELKIVRQEDLLEFNPHNELFKTMMATSFYSQDPNLKIAVHTWKKEKLKKYTDRNKDIDFLDMNHTQETMINHNDNSLVSDEGFRKKSLDFNDKIKEMNELEAEKINNGANPNRNLEFQRLKNLNLIKSIQDNLDNLLHEEPHPDYRISISSFKKSYETFQENEDKGRVLLIDPENIIVPGSTALTLHLLYQTVCSNGGMEKVIQQKIWKRLFYPFLKKTNVSYITRSFYKKHIYEFELYRNEIHEKVKKDFISDKNGKIHKNTKDFNYNNLENLESKTLSKTEKETNNIILDKSRELYPYKFKIGEAVMIRSDRGLYYFGTVKTCRLKGLKQYYIQFYDWPEEYNQWFCEDVIEKQKIPAIPRERPKSTKYNNILYDPLVLEKHSHIRNKANKLSMDTDIPNDFAKS